jgi:hypothetical protein
MKVYCQFGYRYIQEIHKFPITMDLAMFQRIEIMYHVLKFSILI